MKHQTILTHEFVDYIPHDLKEGMVYVCIPYATAVHKCCCGCGNEVVTPLSPMDWELIFNGKSISLDPSIGNWNFPCQSHYWIQRNKVVWARRWSRQGIEDARARDRLSKEKYFDTTKSPVVSDTNTSNEGSERSKSEWRLWQNLKEWWVKAHESRPH